MKYCAGSEKSTHDVLSRLQAWDVPPEDYDDIIKKLKIFCTSTLQRLSNGASFAIFPFPLKEE